MSARADPRALLGRIAVVHITDRWVVINKPAGLLSVPGKGEANKVCAVDWVRARLPHAHGPIVVHRLDMDTSGLLVLALDEQTQRDLSRQFEARTVGKAYTAVVEGHVPAERGQITVPVRADFANRPYQIVDFMHDKPAVTAWRVLAYEPDRTRLELTPYTGRTHQLRVHCANSGPGGLGAGGHPIVGDVLYGQSCAGGESRLLLHASFLSITDPATGGRVDMRCAPDF